MNFELLDNYKKTFYQYNKTRHYIAQGSAAFIASVPLTLLQCFGLSFLSTANLYSQVLLYAGAIVTGFGGPVAGSIAAYKYFRGIKEKKHLKNIEKRICAACGDPDKSEQYLAVVQNARDAANRRQIFYARSSNEFSKNTLPFLLATLPVAVISIMGADSLVHATEPGSGLGAFLCYAVGGMSSAASAAILGASGYKKIQAGVARRIYERTADLLFETKRINKAVSLAKKSCPQTTSDASTEGSNDKRQNQGASARCETFANSDKRGDDIERMRRPRRKLYELTL